MDLRMPVIDLDRIEYSLRTGTKYTAHSRSFDLNKDYLPRVEPLIEASVTDLYGRLQTTEDIESILLTGGGSTVFARAVHKVFRTTPIKLMPDPINANARGYLYAGQSAL